MGHDSQINSAYDPSKKQYDYSSCFQFVKPYIQAADVAIANLEVTLAGRPYKGYPQFSSPDALAVTMKDIGFDALVTANNHCVDRGKKGLERTVRVLDSLDIPHAGTFKDTAARTKDTPLMIYKNGFSIALLNYTYGTNGLPVYKPNVVNLIDTAVIGRDLKKAKEAKPDFIIVFTHWGTEYQSLPSKFQKDVTEFCFRKGAMIVIGAHPHVIQPMEWRKDRNQFVAYSLGNFVSGQRNRYTDGGSMAYLELQKVRFSTDSAITTIDTAGYYLQWVRRTVDQYKDYYVLPAADGDQKNLTFIKDDAGKEAYRLFLSDSRALSKKHNKNVEEIRETPDPNTTTYRVLFLKTDLKEDPWKILTSQKEYIWGIDKERGPDGKIYWTSGNFSSIEDAEKYRQKYLRQHKDAKVVKYSDGRIIE
jgi:poly-gamma-glutamate synthesis protein (capsule biosynthesis protein)